MKHDPRRVQLARMFVGIAVVGAGGFFLFFELVEGRRAPPDFHAAFAMAAVWSVLAATRVARRSIVEGRRGAPLHVLHFASLATATAGVPVCVRLLAPSAESYALVGVVVAAMLVLSGVLWRLGSAAQTKLALGK